MPGLIGFVGRSGVGNGKKFLSEMAQALDSGNPYKYDLFTRDDMGLGRIGLGISNPEPQPIWNEDQNICILMEGELFDYSDKKEDLINRGYKFSVNNDPEFVLHLYEEYGLGFAHKLNGAFLAAIWDQTNEKLIIANDRLGLYPLYYYHQNDALIFASGVRSILVNPLVSKDIDPIAFAQFLTFDHVLDDRTLLKAVRLLPQASLLVFQNRKMTLSRYWEISYPQTYPLRSEFDYMDEFLALMRQAVARQSPKGIPAGILLSGGLDSRILLAYLVSDKELINSFTFGIPGCDDARFAKEIAKVARSQHHFFELKPDWMIRKAEEAVRITDGMGNVVNMHAIATLDEEVEIAQILYKGFLGDAMFGFGLTQQFWGNYEEAIRPKVHLQAHTDIGVITFSPMEQDEYFTDSFKNQIGNVVAESYIAGMDDSRTDLLANQRLYFDYKQRVPRMTLKGVEVVRSQAMVRLPFCDNDLVEFSIKVPPGLLYQRRLVKNAFIREFPKLAQIPTTETGYPLMLCARDVLIRARHVINWHLKSTIMKDFIRPLKRPYQDYKGWFRNELRGWVEGTLLNPRSLERGYLKPECIHQVVNDHMAGKNNAVQLGVLLTLELWHRQFID